MNVLFISPNSPFESVGGIERYITNLIEYYKARKDSEIFLIIPTSGKKRIEKKGNVSIYYEETLSVSPKALRNQKELADKARLLAELVEKIIREHAIDIICAENFMFGPPAVYSLHLNMIATQHDVPIVLRLHMYPSSPLQIELVNQLMWQKISCVSKSVAGDCFQKGADVNILSTDYLGVNTFEFNKDDKIKFSLKKELGLSANAKIIMTASRIIRGDTHILKEKGLINLIQAFSKLSPRYPDLHLLFSVGKSSANLKENFERAKSMLEGYIKLHNIDGKSTIHMFDLKEMPDVYRGADLFVLPAEINETFGQVFIEAMSSGIPVIGTKTGGIPEIISDSYNGYLVAPDDSSILAQRIEKLIKDNSTRDSFVKAGLRTVKEKFTTDRQFVEFHEMLKSVVRSNLN